MKSKILAIVKKRALLVLALLPILELSTKCNQFEALGQKKYFFCFGALGLLCIFVFVGQYILVKAQALKSKKNYYTTFFLLFLGLLLSTKLEYKVASFTEDDLNLLFLYPCFGIYFILSFLINTSKLKTFKNSSFSLLAALLGLTFATVLLEASLRFFVPYFKISIFRVPNTTWRIWHADLPFYQETHIEHYCSDRDIVLSEKADVRPCTQKEDKILTQYLYKSNAIGFRDTGPIVKNYHLIALGDSYTGGAGVEKPWSHIFWEKTGKNTLNLGVTGGAPPIQYLKNYKNFGLHKTTKYVVVGFYEGNDLLESNFAYYVEHMPFYANWLVFNFPQILFNFFQYKDAPPVQRLANNTYILPQDRHYSYPMTLNMPLSSHDFALSRDMFLTLEISKDQIESSNNWSVIKKVLISINNNAKKQNSIPVFLYFPCKEKLYWKYIALRFEISGKWS